MSAPLSNARLGRLVVIACLTACGEPRPSPEAGAAAADDKDTTLDTGWPPIRSIAASELHTCAVFANGGAACWGTNADGQLGDGTRTARFRPVMVRDLSDDVLQVAAGRFHTCALKSDGAVACWGLGGALGDGSMSQSSVPVEVTTVEGVGLARVTSIVAGDFHTCALHDDGAVSCWGTNDDNQMGDGTSVGRINAVRVDGLEGVDAIAASQKHTCARQGTSAWCWGSNEYGQLGDGTRQIRTRPVSVRGLGPVLHIAPGHYHTCAFEGSDRVLCWGRNSSGQLGDGTTTLRIRPEVVPGLTNVVAISMGHHSCVQRADGLLCWGQGSSGELGDGSTVNRTSPVVVSGIGPVDELFAGGHHNCARPVDGDLVCWGKNVNGQLGDGTQTNRSTPVFVLSP